MGYGEIYSIQRDTAGYRGIQLVDTYGYSWIEWDIQIQREDTDTVEVDLLQNGARYI